MDWFLYDNDLRHEKVKLILQVLTFILNTLYKCCQILLTVWNWLA